MKLALVAFLLAVAVPALAGPGISPEQAYIDCVTRQTVQFSPSGKTFEIVLATAILACKEEAASMQSATPEFASVTTEIARRFALLGFMQARAYRLIDSPRGPKK